MERKIFMFNKHQEKEIFKRDNQQLDRKCKYKVTNHILI